MKIRCLPVVSLILGTLALTGCYSKHNLELADATRHTGRPLQAKYQATSSQLEEYVSRVGKRIIMVSDYPEANYAFRVSMDRNPHFDHSMPGEIIISQGFLQNLQDEAELAAVLTQGFIEKINATPVTQPQTPRAEHRAIEQDRNSLIYLVRAGYDPQAFVDLQEAFMHKHSFRPNWLSSFYQQTPPTWERIEANKSIIHQLPPSVHRFKDRYQQYLAI